MLRLLTISALALAVAAPASAATLLAYDTTNGTSVEAISSSVLDGDDLVRGDGVTQNVGGDFNSRGWTASDLTSAAINQDYLQWGFTSFNSLTLDTLDIAYDRSPTGPTTIQIFAQIDSGDFTEIFFDDDVSTTSEVNSIDLTSSILSFAGVSDVTFRLFGFGGTSSAGTFDIETGEVGDGEQYGISLTGTLAAVPLPAGLPLMVGALALLGLTRRKG